MDFIACEFGINPAELLEKLLKGAPSDWHPVASVLNRIQFYRENGYVGLANELYLELINRLNREHRDKMQGRL
jgi:hypothetical protein